MLINLLEFPTKMGRDHKKSNSNNDTEEKVSPKKSAAKGAKNGERSDGAKAAPVKTKVKGIAPLICCF